MKRIALKFLEIYQKFFTLIGYGSCRYYPTCSEYAKWQFQKNSFFKAIFYTIVRILKCNQLFDGGIDYPIVKKDCKCKKICSHNQQDKKDIVVQFYLVPKDHNNYYLIKKFEKDTLD